MKVLVVRFSSIGDVVLTTPVIRCIKQQLKGATVHFITKKAFAPLLEDNPHIDKLITIEKSIKEKLNELKTENYDWVIDLHKNIRTLSLKKQLGVRSASFPKLNFQKWLLVRFKMDKMGSQHIVDRYFETVKELGVKNDLEQCDFFISNQNKIAPATLFGIEPKTYLIVAAGAQFATKRIPFEKMKEILSGLSLPIIISGGKDDTAFAKQLVETFPEKHIVNACGSFNLQQSADLVRQAKIMLTGDTGLMHIASCFKIPIVSVWGNTVPALGMYPYYPKNKELFKIHEVENLSCRPCSKIGYQSCPKKHFNCMMLQNVEKIAEDLTKIPH